MLVGVIAVAMVIWTPDAVLKWSGGILAAALVAYLSKDLPTQLQQLAGRRRERRERLTDTPVVYTAQIKHHDYVVLTDEEGTVEVPASGHTVQVVVTGAAPAPVVLTGLRVEVVSRVDQGGDLSRHLAEVPVRRFEVLLDEQPPQVRPLGGSDFPYQLKRDETEVFDLMVSTESGHVRWVLWLDWSMGGRTGSVRVDLGGQPFQTAARFAVRRR